LLADFVAWAAQHDEPDSDLAVETPHLSGPQRQLAQTPGGKIAMTSVSSTLATVVWALGWAENIGEFLWRLL
jgi:hypothetical protein